MARNHTQDETPTSPATMPLTWRDGSEFDFYSLPMISQVRLAQYGVWQLQDDKSTGAYGKARKLLAGEGGKATSVSNDAIKTWREANEANEAQFETWKQEFMAQVRDEALAGKLELPSQRGDSLSQVARDRNEAARLTIIELTDMLNARKGTNLPAFTEIEKGKGKKEANDAARVANDARIASFLASLSIPAGEKGSMARHVGKFDAHLVAIVDARKAAAAKAPTSTIVVDFGDFESLDEAAE